MGQRVNIQQTRPEVYRSLYGLMNSLNRSSLTPVQKNLIKVRVSQINSCAYCIDKHTLEALEAGETQQRIFLLSAWKETDLFTDEEKALLALTDEVALIDHGGVSDATYELAEEYFTPETIADIIMEAVVMSALNRIGVSTHLAKHIKALAS